MPQVPFPALLRSGCPPFDEPLLSLTQHVLVAVEPFTKRILVEFVLLEGLKREHELFGWVHPADANGQHRYAARAMKMIVDPIGWIAGGLAHP